MKKIIYVDLDGTLADFDLELKKYHPDINTITNHEERSSKVDKLVLSISTFFEDLEPMKDSIESIHELSKNYEIYFLSTAMWDVPHSFTGKRLWIEKHFGEFGKKRLILSHRKDLNIGDYLIDDRLKNGAAEFKGEHIHFGTDKFPNWKSVTNYLVD